MAITIRPAAAADLLLLRTFEQGVIAAERPYDATLRADPIRYYDLEALLASSDAALLVAEEDGQLLGSGYVRLEQAQPFLAHARHGYVGFIFVVPQRRGQGISAAVLRALGAWAGSRGVLELRLEVYPGNAPAMRAYEKLGFAPYLLTMRLRTQG
jgi:GNAT superfamily N-acetyltransferase